MKTLKQSEDQLAEEGLITAGQLAQARAHAEANGRSVRRSLVELKYLDPEAMAHWLSRHLQIPKVELKSYVTDPKVLELVPEVLARKLGVIPLFKVGNILTVATSDPLDLIALDELRLKTGKTIDPVIATSEEILQALTEQYGAQGRLEEIVSGLTEQKVGWQPGKTQSPQPAQPVSQPASPAPQQLESLGFEPPVVRLVNLLLADAVRSRASDIHLEPERERLKVRFRVDGILREFATLPKHLEAAVVSRVKILSSLDIAERRRPQDGRFRVSMEAHELDVRVSVMPAIDGETVVLRLLDAQGLQLGLDQLGMPQEVLSPYRELLRRAWGMILVTGPTGSGKTTTLYASLASLNAVEKNIVTLEDPVEYRLAGIRQIPVNPSVNLTFATGLRSILRQDPDVILVGEVRDRDTSEMSIQAALTGHLVFSTLHTNDAVTAATRLVDMGIEPFLVASSLIAVAAQRLVRRVCPACKVPNSAQEEVARKIGFEGEGHWVRGKGCRQCGRIGYRGRIGLFELLLPDDEMRRRILSKASTSEMSRQAKAAGMRSLREDGLAKAAAGMTTVEEVLRVTEEVG